MMHPMYWTRDKGWASIRVLIRAVARLIVALPVIVLIASCVHDAQQTNPNPSVIREPAWIQEYFSVIDRMHRLYEPVASDLSLEELRDILKTKKFSKIEDLASQISDYLGLTTWISMSN
jgi:hypothetical protein